MKTLSHHGIISFHNLYFTNLARCFMTDSSMKRNQLHWRIIMSWKPNIEGTQYEANYTIRGEQSNEPKHFTIERFQIQHQEKRLTLLRSFWLKINMIQGVDSANGHQIMQIWKGLESINYILKILINILLQWLEVYKLYIFINTFWVLYLWLYFCFELNTVSLVS